MDKTYDYERIHNRIVDECSVIEVFDGYSTSIISQVQNLRTELQTELTPEDNNALYGKNDPQISDETLRGYIRITRSIRAFIFDNLDTHLLTIEKLADGILCKRRAYERRSNKGTNTVVKNVTEPNTSIKTTKVEDATAQVNKLSPEELKNLMAFLQKG